MKNQLLVSVSLTLAAVSGALAQYPTSKNAPDINNDYTLQLEPESKLLARGYAEAFGALQRPITLTMQRYDRLFLLEDVRAVRAIEAILVVEVGRGVNYLVNPRDIVAITDGHALKPVAELKPAAISAPPPTTK
jgi:hypothetical protein